MLTLQPVVSTSACNIINTVGGAPTDITGAPQNINPKSETVITHKV